jgi:hypothetical protein
VIVVALENKRNRHLEVTIDLIENDVEIRMYYSSFDCLMIWLRQKDDPLNAVVFSYESLCAFLKFSSSYEDENLWKAHENFPASETDQNLLISRENSRLSFEQLEYGCFQYQSKSIHLEAEELKQQPKDRLT